MTRDTGTDTKHGVDIGTRATEASAHSAHGLLLLRIPHLDAPLEDAFHAIQRALDLVYRLTIVISTGDSAKNDRHHNNGSINTRDDIQNGDHHGSIAVAEAAAIESSDAKGTTPPSTAPGSSPSFHSVQRLLSALYVSFTKQTMAMKRPLAELDIVFEDSCGYAIGAGTEDEVAFDVLLGTPNAIGSLQQLNRKRVQLGQRTLPLFTLDLTPETTVHTHLVEKIDSSLLHQEPHPTNAQEGEYDDVALGGTFDHLHAGHKILLSMTAWITRHRVVCGVTDDEMLKTKKFKDFMEPLDKRIGAVQRFLRTFKRGLAYDVVPIHDIYGPTITDDKLQALMVSKETLKGGAAVNEERGKRGLPSLKIEVINVISPTETQVDEVSLKISSTFIRQYLSEQAQKPAVADTTTH